VPRRRQKKATPRVVRDINARRRAGETDSAIADDLGMTVRTLQRAAGFRRAALAAPTPDSEPASPQELAVRSW